jgi:small-conductance mechanosensitive channel
MIERAWTAVSLWFQDTLGISEVLLGRIFWTIVVIVVYLVVRWIVAVVVTRRVGDTARQYILLKTSAYLIGFLGLIALVRIWMGGLRGLAAYLGILSAGLAIALQDPLTNLAGWLFIAVRKPFAMGDRVQIGEHAGDVVDFRLFQFSLVEIGNWVDADQSTGRLIHIPNGAVFKQALANYTQGFNFIWNEVPITVTFESNWEKAKEILTNIAQEHSAIQSEHAEREVKKAARKFLIFYQHLTPIVWTSVIDYGVTLTIRYLCEPRKRRSSETAIWEAVLQAFAAADDIDFAYPTQRFYDNAAEGKKGAARAASSKKA